ncbi:[4Fe-4S] proteins maturation [Coemansia sp. Benny D115]|nr:[4Fe-4S] proteins maturation [Coemansia sp. Benny D115]
MNSSTACIRQHWRRLVHGAPIRYSSSAVLRTGAGRPARLLPTSATYPMLAERHSSSSSAAAAKYSLPKLSQSEALDLESKIADYGKPPQQTNTGQHEQKAPAEYAAEADSVVLTDSAIERLRYLSEKRGATQYLRLRVDSGGCYGFSYMLDMTEQPEKDDIVLDRRGAKMVIDECSLPLVRGATIDWQDRLIGQAFLVVANPQSSGGCGCGASFEIKLD